MRNFLKKMGICSALGCSIIYPHSARADDKELDRLLAMSLEELIVTTASKREESALSAPAVVNVINAEEIRNSGARTLFELLARQPSVYAYGIVINSEHSVAIRGNSMGSTNGHTLILMNGRPIRESYIGGFDNNQLRAMPLSLIERVELIRGPGSVLYGTNAFAGVVNIITKKTDEQEGEISASYGSFNTKRTEGAYGIGGEDYNAYGAVSFLDSDGWKVNFNDLSGAPYTDRTENKYANLTSSMEYKGFKLNLMDSYIKEYGLGYPNFMPFQKTWRQMRFLDLGYTHEIADGWDINLNGAYTNAHQRYASAFLFDSDDWLGEVSIKGQLTEKTNLLFGGTWQLLDGEETFANTIYETARMGLYAQVDHQLSAWLKLVAGVQMNDPEGVKKNFSPRLGAIMSLDEHWGLKTMYGQAFRSAYPAEQFVFIPGFFSGDPSLKPEEIATTDAQLFYHDPYNYAALTLFHSKETNTIIAPGAGYINSEGIESYGITLEEKSNITTNWSIQGSASWMYSEEQAAGTQGYPAPDYMFKAGVVYTGWEGITVDVFDDYVLSLDIHNANPAVNPLPRSYHQLTANTIFDLHTLTEGKIPEDVYFSLYGYNLLDEDISASYTRNPAAINAGPGYASGRALYGTLTIKF